MEENQNNANVDSVWKKVIIVVLSLAIGFGCYSIVNNLMSCNSASTKIEVITKPTMSRAVGSLGYSPRVKAQVKNKTSSTIHVELTCSVYDKDGNVSMNLNSGYVTLGAGETTWLTAMTFVDYSITQYNNLCADFGNVEYKFLNY